MQFSSSARLSVSQFDKENISGRLTTQAYYTPHPMLHALSSADPTPEKQSALSKRLSATNPKKALAA
jgi:hypothetical protein